jgi:hypothetical protein
LIYFLKAPFGATISNNNVGAKKEDTNRVSTAGGAPFAWNKKPVEDKPAQ